MAAAWNAMHMCKRLHYLSGLKQRHDHVRHDRVISLTLSVAAAEIGWLGAFVRARLFSNPHNASGQPNERPHTLVLEVSNRRRVQNVNKGVIVSARPDLP